MQYGDFAYSYDELMYNANYDKWVEKIKEILVGENITSGLIIDLACGTGEITNRLYKTGYDMLGVDISEEMLSVAQDKAYEDNLKVRYLTQDMRELNYSKKAKAITCICDGVNYMLRDEDLEAFFESAHKHIEGNGVLIIEFSSKYKLSNVLGNNTITEVGEEFALIWENAYGENKDILEFDLNIFRKCSEDDSDEIYERIHEHHRQRAYDVEEVTNICSKYFDVVEYFDSETNETLKDDSERIMIVLKRKDI